MSASLGSESEFEFEDLSDSTMEAALAGDMSGVNAWGESSVATVDEMAALLERAKNGAPTDEVTQALVDAGEVLDLLREFASSAAESTDFLEFAAEAQTLEGEISALDAQMTEATDVLDAADAEYCN